MEDFQPQIPPQKLKLFLILMICLEQHNVIRKQLADISSYEI